MSSSLVQVGRETGQPDSVQSPGLAGALITAHSGPDPQCWPSVQAAQRVRRVSMAVGDILPGVPESLHGTILAPLLPEGLYGCGMWDVGWFL